MAPKAASGSGTLATSVYRKNPAIRVTSNSLAGHFNGEQIPHDPCRSVIIMSKKND
jgi:hypothetical protein